MKKDFQKLIEAFKEITQGKLENRITHIDKDSEVGQLSWGLNNFLDKVETFMRESVSALSGNDTVRTRVDPRGFNGTFLHVSRVFNEALDEHEKTRNQLVQKEQEASKAKDDIECLLNNLGQGFLVFDQHGVIQPGSSHMTHVLFGKDPTHTPIVQLLQLEETAANSVQEWIGLVFEELLPFDDIKGFAPKSFEKLNDRYIELDFRPIRGRDQKIEKIILIATDKTEERLLQQQLVDEQAFVKVIMTILKDRGAFVDFVQEARSILSDLKQGLEQAPEQVDLNNTFRLMHSLKGGAASFSLMDVSHRAHDFETELGRLKNASAQEFHQFLPELQKGTQEISDLLEAFLQEHQAIIGAIGEQQTVTREVSPDHLVALAAQMEQRLGEDSEVVKDFLSTLVLDELAGSFHKFEKVVTRVAEAQGKEVQLNIDSSPIKIYSPPYKPLFSACIHAFRNAVDHGLETPDERFESEKPSQGTIRVSMEETSAGNDTRVHLQIRDDGRGIDAQKIRQKAVEKGFKTEQELNGLEDHDVIQFVLAAGFSTKDQVTDVSGRGVGLDAIQYEAKKISGHVWIESSPGKGSTLHIDVPLIQKPSSPKRK